MNMIKLTENMDIREKRTAVETALLLGIQTEEAEFPVTSYEDGLCVIENGIRLEEVWKMNNPAESALPSKAENRGEIFNLDFRSTRGLETIFSEGAFLKDVNQDLFPDQVDVKFVIPDDADIHLVAAACNLAFRLGMETTSFKGLLVADEGYEGSSIIFEPAEQCEIVCEEVSEGSHVYVRGSGSELEDFIAQVCEEFPITAPCRTWRDLLMDIIDDFVLRNADGELAALKSLPEDVQKQSTLYHAPMLQDEQRACFPDTEFVNYKSGRLVEEWVYELPWEVDVLEEVLKTQIYPRISDGVHVEIEGALSEDSKVRDNLKQRIVSEIEERGGCLDRIQMLCAFKQGFSWLAEEVLPVAEECNTERIEIAFKPFLPEGQTEWKDENGATPSYHNVKGDEPDKWYDIPIRYLQELYPIEDVIVSRLGISEDNISFRAYEGDEKITYLCKITDRNGESKEFRYLAAYDERPYMDTNPGMGKVHPQTGYLKVIVDGDEVVNQRITTDLEAVWDVYQQKVLPDIEKYVENKTGGCPTAAMQPFFQQLVLDVTASEPDYRVGSREDIISSLDTFHEDLYFTGSDFFKNYGLRKSEEIFDAPGLILPELHIAEGAPVFKVQLYERMAEQPQIVVDGKAVAHQRERESVQAWISGIRPKDRKLEIRIQTTGVEANFLQSYSSLWSDGIAEKSFETGDSYIVTFVSEHGDVFTAGTNSRPEAVKKSILDIDLHEDELIGYDIYREIIEELKSVEGIEVFRTAHSYQGREVYAIRLKPHSMGYLSTTKRLTRCPSVMINARHHANEVSSTNAAFILLKRLLTDETYRNLADNMNLIIVPMENVDGAEIHYELQKEHPNWIFHVARFNAIGKEFYYEHFQKDTIHSEAMGLSRIYERFAPDIMIDNHGVPSHEWSQPFSGYTSPAFKGFWLPRSLLYGYFWYVTDEEYQGNYSVNKAMEDVIADRIAENEDMRNWNQEWSRQFETYAHAWMPKLFPANYYKEMINYWIPYPYNPEHRYPSIRYPWITTVAYTSEVADETAQGEYLNLCARAHVAHDEATIQMLMRAQHTVICRCSCADGMISAEYLRQRPMNVGGSEEI